MHFSSLRMCDCCCILAVLAGLDSGERWDYCFCISKTGKTSSRPYNVITKVWSNLVETQHQPLPLCLKTRKQPWVPVIVSYVNWLWVASKWFFFNGPIIFKKNLTVRTLTPKIEAYVAFAFGLVLAHKWRISSGQRIWGKVRFMNSLGKRSVSITEIDWEPCENTLRTSKSKNIFSNIKRGKTRLVTSCYKTSITTLFVFIIVVTTHKLWSTICCWLSHTSSMLLCPYPPPSNKVQITNLMLGCHFLMVTW